MTINGSQTRQSPLEPYQRALPQQYPWRSYWNLSSAAHLFYTGLDSSDVGSMMGSSGIAYHFIRCKCHLVRSE